MNFLQSPVYFCMLGALAVQLLQIGEYSGITGTKRVNYQTVQFYVFSFVAVLMALIVGYVYFGDELVVHSRMLYFQTGASSPIIIRSLAESVAAGIIPNKVRGRPGIR
ncbi:hypothetical protein [Chitinophaga pinensis]|uniref:Uncharacterized protein n=1 Tax=Chitinophaga pinensis (strain ATCC 43595 / DSM 2588 / LMG 13176 / NBRC 15968 / NCIMB 11800 / UQM 2034) TaxID=485918 RepID=A0A979GA88_CHIPD|nr:hypothetical protein [Chitinophaga pinensis]ACU63804.1 hypothetical protein Cpin_6400 [Chitinophaga pinensis DSM 2588]